MSCPRPYAICGAWSWPHEPCWLGGRRGCAGGADSCAAVAGVGGQRSGSGVGGGTPGAGARSAACLSQARSTGAGAGVVCDGHHVVPAGDFFGTVAPAGNRPGCSVGRRVAGVAPGARVSVSRRRLRRHARAVCAVGSVAHLADVREDRGALVIDGIAARTHGAARGVVTGSLRGSGPRACGLGRGGQCGIESHRLRLGGAPLSLLTLPLSLPVLIFGARATQLAISGGPLLAPLELLAALVVLGVTLAPLAAAAAVRIRPG